MMEEITDQQVDERTVCVDLDAPAKCRWLEAADEFGDDLLELLEKTEEEYDWLLSSDDVYSRWFRRILNSSFWPKLAMRYYGVNLGEYGREICSIARHVGLPTGKLLAANLSYELTQVGSRLANACTSFSQVVGGRPVMARAMDWATPPGLGQYTRFIDFYNGDRYRYTAIGFPGYVGVISAVGQNWALALNQAPQGEDYDLTSMATTLRVREACDTSRSFGGLRKALSRYQTMTSALIHLIGTEPAERVVVEMHGEYVQERGPEPDGSLAAANHFICEEGQEFNGPAEFEVDGLEYYDDTYDRYAAAKRAARGPAGCRRMACELHEEPLLNDLTEQLMLLCPSDMADNRFWVKA